MLVSPEMIGHTGYRFITGRNEDDKLTMRTPLPGNWSFQSLNESERIELLSLVEGHPKLAEWAKGRYMPLRHDGGEVENLWGPPPHPGWVMVWRDASPHHTSGFGRWVPPDDPAVHPVRIGERGHEGISPFKQHTVLLSGGMSPPSYP